MTHLVGVLQSNGHLLTLRTCATPQSGGWLEVSDFAGGDHSRRTHILSTPSGTTLRQASLFALEASHDAMIQSAANCVRVASLGSRAEAQHSSVLHQRNMWVLSAVTCALFTNVHGHSRIWAPLWDTPIPTPRLTKTSCKLKPQPSMSMILKMGMPQPSRQP